LVLLASIALVGPAAEAITNDIQPVLSLDLSERYDNNVMLQNEGAQAGRESFVTSVMPAVGGVFKGRGDTSYSVGLKYAPDYTFFHDLSRESYLRHIGLFDLEVRRKGLAVTAGVAARYTDGTTAPPNWGATANNDVAPALGAPEVRGRRRNMYFESNLVGRQDLGRAFARGVFEARIWDFMTDDTFVQGQVIQNYYDRNDINGGLDLGCKVDSRVEPFLGYRLGHQDQEFRAIPPYNPSAPSYSYANIYHRFIAGLAGKPVEWLTLKGEVGPSFHFFDAATLPAGADTEQDFLYFLASGNVRLATNTTFKVAGGAQVIPSAAGNGLIQNLTASGSLSHRFSPQWEARLSIAYTDYDYYGLELHDQRFVPEAALEYRFNAHLSVRAWYACEWAENVLDVPNLSRRDYDRQVAGLGVKATY
jgi:hypothetical protein